jgi:hypothetical protein
MTQYYTVENSWGELLMVFGARNLSEAARIMLQVQQTYDDMHRVNEVFNLGEATRSQVRAFIINTR